MQKGDTVIYGMRSCPDIGLIDGNKYEVLDTANCKCSYGLLIDIGIKLPDGVLFVTCNVCDTTIFTDGKYFLHFGAFEVTSR